MKKKIWKDAQVIELGIEKTHLSSDYITVCNWVDNDISTTGLGNEDYTDPNKKPAQHPDWVWCKIHNRWHPKDHTNDPRIS